jgi:hypothetical protein
MKGKTDRMTPLKRRMDASIHAYRVFADAIIILFAQGNAGLPVNQPFRKQTKYCTI